MGYAQTTIILYGVAINSDTAKQIYEHEFNEDGEFSNSTFGQHVFFRPIMDNIGSKQQLPVSPYKQHDTGSGSQVFYPDMLADDTDSRIHNLNYEDDAEHYLGIYVASKGYAYHDDIKFFIKQTPPEVIQNFELFIKPLMQKYNIENEPDVHLISQVW